MLTDKELDTYKICEIPTLAAMKWLNELFGKERAVEWYMNPGDICSTGQQCSLGSDTDELFIYRHSDGKYYLVQCLVGEVVE